MTRLRWFFRLVWRPFHGGPITIRDAWAVAGILSGDVPCVARKEDC